MNSFAAATCRRVHARSVQRWRALPAPARSRFHALLVSGLLITAAATYSAPPEMRPWWWVPAILGGLPILISATRPGRALLCFGVIISAYVTAVPDVAPAWVATAAVLYQVVAHGSKGAPVAVAAVGVCTVLVTSVIVALRLEGSWIEPSLLIYAFVVPAMGVGWGAAARLLRLRNAELERLRAVELRAVVADERRRIAGDVHDVVGHHLVAIAVRARTLEQAAASEPAARSALSSVASAASEALTSMRKVVAMLRDPDQVDDRVPQPGTAQLVELVGGARRSGLSVELQMPDLPMALPIEVDVAAFRIIQEALTNVLRHASATRAQVTLRVGSTGVEVSVADDGRTGAVPGGVVLSGRHGLIGMRERATGVGGVLEVGRSRLGGWLVRAELPIGATS